MFKLIVLGLIYLVVFNVTLVYFVELMEQACSKVLFSVDKWIMEEDEAKTRQPILQKKQEREMLNDIGDYITGVTMKVL